MSATLNSLKRRLQRERLRAIADWHDQHGYAPSVRETGDAFGLQSTAATVYALQRLRDAGWVEWQEGQTRTLRLTPAGKALIEEEREPV